MLKRAKFFLFIFVTFITMDFIFLTANSTFAAYPDGVISHWKLDEAPPGAPNGTYEDSFNGNDGTGDLNPTAAIGIVNGAQDFSGELTGINVPADGSLNWLINESFSIEFWVKTGGVPPGTNQVIIGRDDAATDLHWWVGIHGGDGKIAFVLRDTSGDGAAGDMIGVGTMDPTDGWWHHVVAGRDDSTNENFIYVDGVLQGSTTFDYGAGFGSNAAALNIGWLNFLGGYRFQGLLDEIALYDRALTYAEIQQHYDAGLLGQGILLEPVANAGPDQIVFDEITLDGSLSNHPDGVITSYQWQLNHRQNSAFNRTANGAGPAVLNLKKGFYDVTLIVEDDEGRTDTDQMLFSATGPKGDFDFDGDIDGYDLSVFFEYYDITE